MTRSIADIRLKHYILSLAETNMRCDSG